MITDKGLDILGHFLSRVKSLRKINLKFNGFLLNKWSLEYSRCESLTDKGIQRLCKGLSYLSKLHQMKISFNKYTFNHKENKLSFKAVIILVIRVSVMLGAISQGFSA